MRNQRASTGRGTALAVFAGFHILFGISVCHAADVNGVLENPVDGGWTSGIGLISGWVCESSEVMAVIDETRTLTLARGTQRGDTQSICGDSDNGFGLLYNFNLLGDGEHRIRVLADGVEFASADFRVKTLGESFRRGLSGTALAPEFPGKDRDSVLLWQEAGQGFSLIEGAAMPREVLDGDWEGWAQWDCPPGQVCPAGPVWYLEVRFEQTGPWVRLFDEDGDSLAFGTIEPADPDSPDNEDPLAGIALNMPDRDDDFPAVLGPRFWVGTLDAEAGIIQARTFFRNALGLETVNERWFLFRGD